MKLHETSQKKTSNSKLSFPPLQKPKPRSTGDFPSNAPMRPENLDGVKKSLANKMSLGLLSMGLFGITWINEDFRHFLHASTLRKTTIAPKNDPSWTKFTKSCDVHIIAQVHLRTSGLLDNDISGLLHTSLAQHGAGALQSLRDILQTIFQSELEVVYDIPPQGRIAAHRQQVHDLFLPLGESSSLEGFSCTTLLRRYILGRMLNGDLEADAITHYCTFGCCKDFDDTMSKMCSYVVWALLPGKLPRFAKSRWNNQDRAANWCGLLTSHHGLLTRILTKFTGVSEVPLQIEAKPAPLAGIFFFRGSFSGAMLVSGRVTPSLSLFPPLG